MNIPIEALLPLPYYKTPGNGFYVDLPYIKSSFNKHFICQLTMNGWEFRILILSLPEFDLCEKKYDSN